MTPAAKIILDLTHHHWCAAKDGEEEKRARLFRLLEDFEWAYPEAMTEVKAMYPGESGEQN